jgi:hypothetical protein
MARYNEIQVGRYNRSLQKLLSMKGPAALESLQPELVAVINTFYGTENRYLEGWDTFSLGTADAGTSGNLSAIRIRNPVGSGIVAVLTKANVSVAVSEIVRMSFGSIAGDLSVVVTPSGSNLDLRGRPFPTCVISHQSTAGTADSIRVIDDILLPTNTPYDFIVDSEAQLPLLPGSAYDIVGETVTTAIHGSFRWRERVLEESERT